MKSISIVKCIYILLFTLLNSYSVNAQIESCLELLKRVKVELDSKKYLKATAICDKLHQQNCEIKNFKYLNQIAIAYIEIGNNKRAKIYFTKSIDVATVDQMETIKSSEHFDAFNELLDVDSQIRKRTDNLIRHHQELKIFSHHREYLYSALRISADNDTIVSTSIKVIPRGTGWGHPAASVQSEVVYNYTFSEQDSIDNIDELKRVVTEDFWIRNDTTGIEENENELWIHPFRNNQFYKTELAPFPNVIFPISQESIKEANTQIYILRNWGTYSPSSTDQKYFYEGIVDKDYDFIGSLDCHRFSSYGHNSKFGISYLEYFYNSEYGFTEMNYQTYDNEKIVFVLREVKEISPDNSK